MTRAHVLAMLAHMPHSGIEVAAHFGVKPSEAIELLHSLVADGLVERGTRLWDVTAAGRAAAEAYAELTQGA